jgi:flagellar capping protein FliD
MAGITGISSGLDTESIIKGLMSLKRQQVTNLSDKKEKALARESTWRNISADLITLQLSNYKLSRTATFGMKNASSSNESALSVNASISASSGTYSFFINQLAQSSQLTSAGFSDYNNTTLTSSTKTFNIESSNANLERFTELSSLNGGKGIIRGEVFVQDRDGNSATLDLSSVNDIYDVVDAFNNSGLKINANINANGNGIDIAYTGESTSSNLVVKDIGNGTTASSLGINTGNAGIAADIKNGDNVYYLSDSLSLNHLNNGLGVEKGEFIIDNNGTEYIIDISRARNIGDILSAINSAGADVTASIDPSKNKLTLTGEPGSNLVIKESNNMNVAKELGLLNITGESGSGKVILGGLGSTLISNLSGRNGSGIREGNIEIVGDLTSTIAVSEDDSIVSIINKINTETENTGVIAKLNNSKNGIELYHESNTAFSVTNNDTTSDLGISGNSTNGKITGNNLNFNYLNRASLLSELNQGDGFTMGSISITSTIADVEESFDVNLRDASITTLGDVIDAINLASSEGGHDVVASMNANGDGLLIKNNTDDGIISVRENGNSTTAKSLGILGTADNGILDGSMKKTIEITEDFTLDDLKNSINNLGINMKASIINDGSVDPFRLVLTSTKSGRNGAFTISSELDNLQINTSVEAQDSLVIMGEPTSSDAIFVKNQSNTVSNFISGMTLNLKETSTSQINVTVTNNDEGITDLVEEFVENYNTVMGKIHSQLKYDNATGVTNPLFGDSSLVRVQQDLFSFVNRGAPELESSIRSISQVGISLGMDGMLSLNKNTFESALNTNFDDVSSFFTNSFNTASNATFSTTSTTIEGNVSNLNDGKTSGNTGWKTDNGGFVEMNLGKKTDLTSLKIFGNSDNANDIINRLTVQSWNGSSWVDQKAITNNNKKDININFLDGLVTDKIRINNIYSKEGTSIKINEVQAFQPVGLAQFFDYKIGSITDVSRGVIDSSLDSVSSEVGIIDNQIGSLESRLSIEEDRLRKQFVELEKIMGQLDQTASWLTQQSTSLNANWNYK